MGDLGGAPGGQEWLLAETLGLAMARRAADVLSRHRAALAGGDGLARGEGLVGGEVQAGADGLTGAGGGPGSADPAEFAAEDAVFTAVLNAANECLGRFDSRPAADRWCDALFQVLCLADSDTPG